MKEVFQNYEHYHKWIWDNWEEKTRELDQEILKLNLMVERKNNCNGESHRLLTKTEFLEMEKNGFIFVPTVG